MAFVITPYPEFSWSISRQRLFEQCPRAYYFRYYLSHNGWLDEASPRARQAWTLGKLTTLDALLGGEIDARARELEACAREGRPFPTAADMEGRTREALRTAWRSSKDREAFESHPNRVTMLRSFYLDQEPPAEEEVARLNHKLPLCMERLRSLADWERLAACGAQGCVPIPAFAHFFLDEVKVFAAADLAYVHEGRLYSIDWKSGRAGDDDEVQVLLQVVGLQRTHDGLDGLPVTATLHYLAQGREERVTIPSALKEEVREVVTQGVRGMRAYLHDPEWNIPLEEAEFPRCPSALCRFCGFGPLCE